MCCFKTQGQYILSEYRPCLSPSNRHWVVPSSYPQLNSPIVDGYRLLVEKTILPATVEPKNANLTCSLYSPKERGT